MSQPATERFLRSINLDSDLDRPERVAHYHPTSKNVQLIKAIAGLTPQRALLAIAAYGSGKSLAAAYSAHLVMGDPHSRSVMQTLAERLRRVDKRLGDYALECSRARKPKGLAVILKGYQDDIVKELRTRFAAAFKRVRLPVPTRSLAATESLSALLQAAGQAAREHGIERIAVIWDEFGRHLEGLVSRGRAQDLSVLQQLAELVSRQTGPITTLTLILHQGFFHYASALSQSARNEWKKIEGRFEAIEYVDDSCEMYRLIAQVVTLKRGSAPAMLPSAQFGETASRARAAGLFADFRSEHELAEVLRQAYPMDPATLFMLPRLASRVAQNERTVFSFIETADLHGPVTLNELYDYFAPAMCSDTAIGGTHRQWLETESALSKANSAEEERILKSACLLGLGLSGQRLRVGLDVLAFAASGYQQTVEAFTLVIKELICRKLLLYRQHNDDVSVWHGTDADLRGRLDEEKLRASSDFSLLQFLELEHPAPTWRSHVHNSKFLIRRFFVGRYVEANSLLKGGLEHPVWQLTEGQDGAIVYALPQSPVEIEQLEALAHDRLKDPGLVLAIPREPLNICDPALELWALARLQKDYDLIGTDPLILPELQQMADDARQYLSRLMGRLLNPAPQGPRWYAVGKRLPVASGGQLRAALSRLMDEKFPWTPRINSEAIVRTQLTRPMVNARKKLLLGTLERTGQRDLGFEGTTPDASMYRTVFAQRGLYRQDRAGIWGWAKPEELSDQGLRALWEIIHDFLTEPSEGSKSPSALFSQLLAAPFGVRRALLPVLFAAGLKAFPTALSILKQGEYLPDILAGDIEDICANPSRYIITVYPMDNTRRAYLTGLIEVFASARGVADGDLIRECYDAIEAWKRRIPLSALSISELQGEAREFQLLIRHIADPAKLFFEQLPTLAGRPGEPSPAILPKIVGWRDELVAVTRRYETEALEAIETTLLLDQRDTKGILGAAAYWGCCIPEEALSRVDNVAKAVVRTAKQAASGRYSLERFAEAFSMILLGKHIAQWDDRTPDDFRVALRGVVSSIEEAAISSSASGSTIALIQSRLRSIYTKLVGLAGEQAARAFLDSLKTIRDTKQHVDHKRCLNG